MVDNYLDGLVVPSVLYHVSEAVVVWLLVLFDDTRQSFRLNERAIRDELKGESLLFCQTNTALEHYSIAYLHIELP